MRVWTSIASLPVILLLALSCGPTSYEEYFEFRELAEITAFAVPDSVSATNIPVSISAILGKTTASSLNEIVWARTDSLFELAVFAKRIERYGDVYEPKDITLDTTLVLSTNPPRTGWHYFRIVSSIGTTLVDSSRLY